MSWTQATFTNRTGKRQEVWVELDDDGAFVVTEGRVPMRYSNEDDAKLYSANPNNLSLDPADTKSKSSKPKASSSKKKSGSTSYDDLVWQSPEGGRVESTAVPGDLADEPAPADGVVDVWTDGACTGNPGPCGYGVVIRHGETYREIGQFLGMGTNNIAELFAIYVAIEETADLPGQIEIHTDSGYSIGVLSKGWKAKANVELIGAIKKLIASCDPKPKFVKVKGHAGIPLNERADDLAVDAVERRK